jgi:hypothetical protein
MGLPSILQMAHFSQLAAVFLKHQKVKSSLSLALILMPCLLIMGLVWPSGIVFQIPFSGSSALSVVPMGQQLIRMLDTRRILTVLPTLVRATFGMDGDTLILHHAVFLQGLVH